MAYKLLGKNFVPPDVRGKVTGQAKYAEDFRAEGMVFCRLLLSPMPHARVRSIDSSRLKHLQNIFQIIVGEKLNHEFAAVFFLFYPDSGSQ